ncbi:hypothetical protein NDN16_18560 [Aureimonas altamirensis]|uniref:hypothetical protein n=1 Tax=Aureimonas altamirensis TaxID=370622 RepID=UPI00255467E9|nr:hypothetical protein [Aureimonas altamirensis]MCM2505673.1 hypothetical protein [Aureimonas altamirensis]
MGADERLALCAGFKGMSMSLDQFTDDELPLLARLHEQGKIRLTGMKGHMPFIEVCEKLTSA